MRKRIGHNRILHAQEPSHPKGLIIYLLALTTFIRLKVICRMHLSHQLQLFSFSDKNEIQYLLWDIQYQDAHVHIILCQKC